MMIIATIPLPPSGTEWPWLLNALMWLFVINAIGGLALIVKKLTGRTPSLDEVLGGLVTIAQLEDYSKEQHIRHRGLEEQISNSRHEFSESFMGIIKRGEERDRMIETLRDTISRLQERTETHIRKFDQIENRLERLLERVSRTVFEMRKNQQ